MPQDDSKLQSYRNKNVKVINCFSVIFRVYCADHTYCTLRLPIESTAETIKLVAADKLKMRANDELVLVEVKSNGERVLFKDEDISIPTALSINGRIFVSPKDHQDALVSIIDVIKNYALSLFLALFRLACQNKKRPHKESMLI